MLKILRITAFVLTLSASLSSCHSKSTDGYIIEYEIKPVNSQHPLASLAPDRAVLRYKHNHFKLEMEAMNVFNTAFIYSPQQRLFAQTFHFMDIRKVCVDTEDDIHKAYGAYQLKLEETPDTMTIAGYLCKRVKVSLVQEPGEQFDVYYCPDLEADNSNDLNPYKGIKGMLLQYRIKRMGLELNFKAISVTKANLPDQLFEIPADYKRISRDEMDKIFTEIQ